MAAACAALLIGGPVPAGDPPPAPPDPQIFEFLGDLGGEEALFILFTTSREARKAAKDAQSDSGADRQQALATSPEAVAWETLEPPVQFLLARYGSAWTALPPDQQRALLGGAQRWLTLDGIGRAQANERWETWRSLTPEQRKRVEKAWRRFGELTPAQQQAVRTAYLRFQELTPEQRAGLLEHLQAMSPEELRRKMNRRQGKVPGSEDKRPCPPC